MAKVKLNLQGFRQLRTSDAAQELVDRAAKKIADTCGEGFEAESSPGRNRARATVRPVTPEARARNARDLTVLKNMDAGR